VTTSPAAWRSRPFCQPSSSRLDPQSDARQESATGVSSESKRAVALRHLSHRPRRIFRWGEGACGGRWSSPRPETRRESYEESEGGKRKGESCWKSGEGRSRLYTADRRAGKWGVSDAIPATAGGEGVTGAGFLPQYNFPAVIGVLAFPEAIPKVDPMFCCCKLDRGVHLQASIKNAKDIRDR
jgi:hypothetical protein